MVRVCLAGWLVRRRWLLRLLISGLCFVGAARRGKEPGARCIPRRLRRTPLPAPCFSPSGLRGVETVQHAAAAAAKSPRLQKEASPIVLGRRRRRKKRETMKLEGAHFHGRC